MIYRLLENFLVKRIESWIKKLPKCEQCKKTMRKIKTPQLFLLPVFHDGEYTPSEQYYFNNCKRIAGIQEIPTGRRACRLWLLTCPACGRRKIFVEDFLRVRDTEVLEKCVAYGCDGILMQLFNGKGLGEPDENLYRQEVRSRNTHLQE